MSKKLKVKSKKLKVKREKTIYKRPLKKSQFFSSGPLCYLYGLFPTTVSPSFLHLQSKTYSLTFLNLLETFEKCPLSSNPCVKLKF